MEDIRTEAGGFDVTPDKSSSVNFPNDTQLSRGKHRRCLSGPSNFESSFSAKQDVASSDKRPDSQGRRSMDAGFGSYLEQLGSHLSCISDESTPARSKETSTSDVVCENRGSEKLARTTVHQVTLADSTADVDKNNAELSDTRGDNPVSLRVHRGLSGNMFRWLNWGAPGTSKQTRSPLPVTIYPPNDKLSPPIDG